MKQLASTFMLILCASLTFAQLPPKDANTGKYTYLNTVQATKLTAAEITERTKTWGTDEANSSGKKKWTILESNGTMVKFDGYVSVSYPGTKGGTNLTGKVKFTFRVDAKEGKFRYIVTDFKHEEPRGSGGKLEEEVPVCGTNRLLPKSWASIKRQANAKSLKVIDDLKRVIREFENDPARNDDW